jgi:hypothetical protein
MQDQQKQEIVGLLQGEKGSSNDNSFTNGKDQNVSQLQEAHSIFSKWSLILALQRNQQ